MSKRFFAVILVLAFMLCASGCQKEIRNAVEQEQTPDFLVFDLRSQLICTVRETGDGQCLAQVTEGNGTYDKETVILISFHNVTENQSIAVGDVIQLQYDYVSDVSAVTRYEAKTEVYRNIPHIQVDQVTIIPDYVPPETVPETTEQ